MKNLYELEGLVWCDAEGTVHDWLDKDPNHNGPVLDDEEAQRHYPDNSAWTLEDRDDGYGEVWHYECPGPHFMVWQGRELF